jgi:hypothetical protein
MLVRKNFQFACIHLWIVQLANPSTGIFFWGGQSNSLIVSDLPRCVSHSLRQLIRGHHFLIRGRHF